MGRDLLCDVCKREKASGVYGFHFGQSSYASCDYCLKQHAQPFHLLLSAFDEYTSEGRDTKEIENAITCSPRKKYVRYEVAKKCF